jgi:hypothetical protein
MTVGTLPAWKVSGPPQPETDAQGRLARIRNTQKHHQAPVPLV